jgi:hypothetical protein
LARIYVWLEGKQCNFILSSSDDDFLDMLPHSLPPWIMTMMNFNSILELGKVLGDGDASRISLGKRKIEVRE